ncbi:ataxin-7-like protein 2b isoform X2 [Trematomus bernacchii]|uniref:ataxin-7-like protein 2b isoform X2 n=1 Tax=Trematomus bernacchii TaxID=40690 RepID=UPI00146EDB8E|nr:ataxin-7-like protein 2b isoform X2 [Trematomus bernacchii]
MAALDRRNPNLDDFVGLNWSCWVVKANILPSDAGSNVEDSSKNGRNRCETMALRREDMHTFGHCPSHDEMYLVVCSHCGQVVKPQAFEKHCERRHGPLTKVCGQSPAPQPRPRSVRPSTNNPCSRERQKGGRCHEAIAPSSAAPPAHQHMPSTAQKEAVSFPSVEKFPQENVPLPHSSPSSTPRPRVPAWHSGPLPPGHCSSSTSPSERPSPQKTTAGQSSEALSPQRGTRTYSRIYKNISSKSAVYTSEKECDLDKQSRVLDPERKKLCSRELICNTDSIHQQQKALGRSNTLAQLAEEQKPASIGHALDQLLVNSKDKEQHLEAFEDTKTTQTSKTFNSNFHIPRSEDPSENVPEEECDSAVEVEAPPQRAFNQSQLSAEESEDDEKDEDTDLPATPLHPKPLGLCTFGCRTLGCSIFTFNRRLHHLRFAVSAMLEHHVSTHLWKKMPQVSSGLRSCQVSSPAVGSAVRTEARSSKSTGSLSLDYTSLGQLETKPSLHKSPSFKSPSSPATATLGPGRRRNPAGKARLREEELMQDASALQKAAMLSNGGEGKSSKCIRDPPLNEKGQPHVPSSQGAVNDTFSNVNKPCPPLQRSPRSKARAPGIQQQGAGCNNRALAEKRKGSDESTSLSSSLSRTSKCQRLSSPSR